MEQAHRFKAADDLFLLASRLRRDFENDLYQKKKQLDANNQVLNS